MQYGISEIRIDKEKGVGIIMQKKEQATAREDLSLKYVMLLYIFIVAIHFLLQLYPKRLVVHPDEDIYYNAAKNLFIYGLDVSRYPPGDNRLLFYSFVLAPFFAIKSVKIRLWTIELFKSLVMNSAIFPSFLLGKKYLRSKRVQWIFLLICATVPEFMMSQSYMCEVIYYPAALWVTFYLYGLLEERDFKKLRYKAIVIGILFYMIYWIKEVALAYLFPVILYYIAKGVFNKEGKEEKIQDIIVALLIFGSFLAARFLVTRTILYSVSAGGALPALRSQKIIANLNSIYALLYSAYSFVYNFLGMEAAYFFLPVLLPLVCWKQLKDTEKKLFTVILLSVLLHIAVLSTMISVRESPGAQAIRIHLRYYAYLFVPFLLIFFCCIEDKKLIVIKEKTGRNPLVFPLTSLLLVFLTVFQGVTFAIVDCSALKLWATYSSRINPGLGRILSGGAGQVNFDLALLLAKIFIVIMLSLGVYFLSRSRLKTQIVFFAVLFLGLNIARSASLLEDYHSWYRISDTDFEQVLELQEICNTLDGDVTFIFKDAFSTEQSIVDEYIFTKPSYNKLSLSLMGINTANDETAIYYIDRVTTDYVIARSVLLQEEEGLEEMHYDRPTGYRVYRRENNASVGVLAEMFPQEKGKSLEIPCLTGFLRTQYTPGLTGFCSDDYSGALVYGPYWKIKAGAYRVDFIFSVDEKLQQSPDSIGYVDINIPDLGGVLATESVYADQNTVSLEFTADSDAGNAETRFFTAQAGITVERIKITRLD